MKNEIFEGKFWDEKAKKKIEFWEGNFGMKRLKNGQKKKSEKWEILGKKIGVKW